VKAAVAYATHGTNEILIFEDCFKRNKKLTFYGRADGTCPIDLRILSWFLKRQSPNAVCRLVPHWLHAKVIWWVGKGAYIGSANLTDRAWFKNYEAGIYLTEEELEHAGLILELDKFFEGLATQSYELTQEEYEKQERLARNREALLKKLSELENAYEEDHWKLSDRSSQISDDVRNSNEKRIAKFKAEWNRTLQKIRDVGARVALDESRPGWINKEVPEGVQGDQFLHAYYYQQVRPMSERDAYERDHNKNKKNPEAALKAALQWWKDTVLHEQEQEANMIYQDAPRLEDLFARGKIGALSEAEWVEGLSMVHAFGDHANKVPNNDLGLGKDPGGAVKTETLARLLFNQSSLTSRFTAPEVFDYVIWGSGDVAERIWTASYLDDYKIRHIGPNIYGEIVGWARPSLYPPRNTRTSKALRALGYDVQIAV